MELSQNERISETWEGAPRVCCQVLLICRGLESPSKRADQKLSLDCDIATEEERARISDRSNFGYPILTRTLAARRDNLRDIIASPEQRLRTIRAPLIEAVAAPGRLHQSK